MPLPISSVCFLNRYYVSSAEKIRWNVWADLLLPSAGNPTKATDARSVPAVPNSEPWNGEGSTGKYKYYPQGNPMHPPKEAPSALNQVIIPNVNLPKVSICSFDTITGDNAEVLRNFMRNTISGESRSMIFETTNEDTGVGSLRAAWNIFVVANFKEGIPN